MALAYIEGIVKGQTENKIIVLTNVGTGYEIFCSKSYLNNETVNLFLTTIYRENSQEIFGFESFEEKLFYELLLNVKGIGPKSAFALLNNLGASQVQTAIIQSDKKLLQSAPGIGAKAAAQIVLDLGNKIGDWIIQHDPIGLQKTKEANSVSMSDSLVEEALNACKELGFKEAKIRPLISQILTDQKFTKAEDLVESLLRSM